MGILDTVKSAIGGQGNNHNDLISSVMELVGKQQGGLNGFVNQFTSKGLGNVVSSWVSTGKNLPISSEQIHNVLGEGTVNSMASKLGMEKNALAGQLSNLLPQLVDKLTPDGKIPEGDIMSKGKEIIGGLFGGK